MFACLRACDSGFLPPRQLRLANLNVECLVFGRAELELKRRVARFVTEWEARVPRPSPRHLRLDHDGS